MGQDGARTGYVDRYLFDIGVEFYTTKSLDLPGSHLRWDEAVVSDVLG